MDIKTIKHKWTEILEYMRTEFMIPDAVYKTWLSPMFPFALNGTKLIINFTDKQLGMMGIDFIKKKYLRFLETSIETILNESYEIELVLSDQISEEDAASSFDTNKKRNESYDTLNSKYTFDTFVVGKSNHMAHAASVAVAASPGEAYNPLFLYSGPGLGKTHLMQSIAHDILEHNENALIRYVTSEKFTNELIESIRNNKTAEFREKYRNVDMLLIDDIQFIIGKESTQEEFFHTFNTLYDSKKHIVISSDKPPKDIATLEERLRSRFEMGLIVDIGNPDYETRMAILSKKNETDSLGISNDILAYFAENIKSNIRELEGALSKLVALSRLKKQPITMELAQEALKDYISTDNHKTITVSYIVDIVSEHMGISSSDIYSKKRNSEIASARQIVMYLATKLTDLSTTDIGKQLNKRDHSTVIHGRNKIEEDLKLNPQLQNTIDVLLKKINP
ncbi:MAG: chromosomal replication initiator protein DnaA [Lachnospiraceae bacterium]|nr:chromosomal replication initiator protein DnaA [Lachnospiraceae bacterium]